MITKNYKKGIATIQCDSCGEEIGNDGFDGKPDFMGVIDDARKEGWIIKKIAGNWYHFCSGECYEDSGMKEEE